MYVPNFTPSVVSYIRTYFKALAKLPTVELDLGNYFPLLYFQNFL